MANGPAERRSIASWPRNSPPVKGGDEIARPVVALNEPEMPLRGRMVSRASAPVTSILLKVVGKMMPVSKKLLLSC